MSKQRNRIGIVNKQKREGKPGSGTTSHKKDPSGEYRRQGTMGGVGLWKKKTETAGTNAGTSETNTSTSSGAAAQPQKTESAAQPQKTESKERRSITKRSAAHTRMKKVTGGTQTQKVAAKGRYRGKGVVDKRP